MKLVIEKKVKLLINFMYDLLRYQKHSSSFSTKKSESKLLAQIALAYHTLEKGFTYSNFRKGFGQEKIIKLSNLLNEYAASYGNNLNLVEIKSGVSALKNYYDLHNKLEFELPKDITRRIVNTISKFKEIEIVDSFIDFPPKDNYAALTFKQLVDSRHSIRNFEQKEVPIHLVEESIKMAVKAPSVCNRQAARVHILNDQQIRLKALDIQGGSKGFSDKIPLALVITFNVNFFYGTAERNQGYIDSGLFTMNLINALLVNNLGTCPLHWSVNLMKDKQFRKEINIPENEEIVLLLGVGFIPQGIKVAASNRKSIEEITHIH